jgi:hypothetical protein
MIRYNLARTHDDVPSLRALLQQYPTWKEPREALQRLGTISMPVMALRPQR